MAKNVKCLRDSGRRQSHTLKQLSTGVKRRGTNDKIFRLFAFFINNHKCMLLTEVNEMNEVSVNEISKKPRKQMITRKKVDNGQSK